MKKNEDGSVTLSKQEFTSLKKMVKACSDAISSMPSDGDFLGWDNYRALQMWEDKLDGKKGKLSWYVDEDEEDEEEEEPKKKNAPATVDAWLDAYGKKRKG